MAKFLDKSMEEWEDMVEQWHNDESLDCSLKEYMGLNDIEYLKFTHNITDEDISDEEVLERSKSIVKDAVTELVIKPMCQELVRGIMAPRMS